MADHVASLITITEPLCSRLNTEMVFLEEEVRLLTEFPALYKPFCYPLSPDTSSILFCSLLVHLLIFQMDD